MKPALMLLVICAVATVATAQDSADEQPADVRVVSQKWSKKSAMLVTQQRSYDPFPTPLPAPPMTETPQVRQLTLFAYEVRVRNTGARTIRGVRWDYVFSAPDTQEEVSRQQFYSEGKIRPNQEKTLTGSKVSPPTAIVNAGMPETERVVINCLLYTDGSVWRRATFTENCAPPKPPRRR